MGKASNAGSAAASSAKGGTKKTEAKDDFKNQKCAVYKAMITERDGFLLGR